MVAMTVGTPAGPGIGMEEDERLVGAQPAAGEPGVPGPAPGGAMTGGAVMGGAAAGGAGPDRSRRRRFRRQVAAGVVVLILLVVAVSMLAGGRSGSDVGPSSVGRAVPPEPAPAGTTTGGSAGESAAGGRSAAGDTAGSGAGSVAPPAAVAPSAPGPGAPDSKPGPSSSAARPAGVQPRIVRTGTTTVEVAPGKVDIALRKISAAAAGFGGYTSASDSSGTPSTSDHEAQSASVTLRVPTASFDRLRDAVAEAGTVRSARMSTQDVTGQYVDLQARKTALETSRRTYLTMLGQAKTVGETLAVQQQVDNVQMQIEQIEGQRKVLGDSSDLATLTVQINEAGAPATGPKPEPSGMSKALHRSWDRFVHGLEEIISGLGTVVLYALLLGAIYALYALYRSARRRRAPRPPGAIAASAGEPTRTAGRPAGDTSSSAASGSHPPENPPGGSTPTS
jgi:hypothetical protein